MIEEIKKLSKRKKKKKREKETKLGRVVREDFLNAAIVIHVYTMKRRVK